MECKKHKKYKAIRTPRATCIPCWQKYLTKHNITITALDLVNSLGNNEVQHSALATLIKRAYEAK